MEPHPPLSRDLLPALRARTDLVVPSAGALELPERAVQFGTGAFLRGFVEYFLDEANRRGEFGGRVVAVGSTGSGRDALLNEQDGLYTLVSQGLVEGEPRQEVRVVGSLSRAISARGDWDAVLACARDPALELVFSNTTEVGIVLDPDDSADLAPPRSFPGKLTRFLLERARCFHFDPARGLVVLPCELIEDNGDRLREIVRALARKWELEESFLGWLDSSVRFCNTLVDRIVPGAPDEHHATRMAEGLGYRDDLLITAEPYRLFVIQGDQALRARLGFARADPGVVVTGDVRPYRERKVRLLNGTHTILVPLALLAGCQTVAGAMRDEWIGAFVRRALFEEIVPGLDVPGAEEFARGVLDRFGNPFIRHALFDITLQGTAKMRVRVVPSMVRYAERTGRAPASLALGFAAHLLLLRGDLQDQRRAAGLAVPADEQGARIRSLWNGLADGTATGLTRLAEAACADEALWGTDLSRLPGFTDAVAEGLIQLVQQGPRATLCRHLADRGLVE